MHTIVLIGITFQLMILVWSFNLAVARSYQMKTIIHINKNLKQSNDKHGRTLPVCRVEVDGKTWYGSKVDILGPSSMVYSPDKPRKCGAKLWIETDSDVVIHNRTTYAEMRRN